MHVSPALRSHITRVLSLCSLAVPVAAQHPALTPTSDVAIVANGTLHYSSILVPAGVTVRFVAPLTPTLVPSPPAIVRCDGDAVVHGTLSVAGDVGWVPPFTSAAGWVLTGEGQNGFECNGSMWFPPQGGRHAGSYGSVLPFSLEGGSPGGDLSVYAGPICTQFVRSLGGGRGGGTLVLHAHGRLEVSGTVTADGDDPIVSSGGSGGSILLRGDAGVSLLPGSSITARGGAGGFDPATFGARGYIRLDAWGRAPLIQGVIAPAPTVIELPHLRTLSVTSIGTTWVFDVFAPENAPVFVAASFFPGPGVVTPFGSLDIDLPTAAGIGVAVAQPSHDPMASVPWAVPNVPALVGLQLFVQAFAAPTGLPPRLSNTLAVVVG